MKFSSADRALCGGGRPDGVLKGDDGVDRRAPIIAGLVRASPYARCNVQRLRTFYDVRIVYQVYVECTARVQG